MIKSKNARNAIRSIVLIASLRPAKSLRSHVLRSVIVVPCQSNSEGPFLELNANIKQDQEEEHCGNAPPGAQQDVLERKPVVAAYMGWRTIR
jgi:hypothetical protein